MILYLIKINIALSLLYGFYLLLCRRDTFFGLRRATLLGSYVVALLSPLLPRAHAWLQSSPAAGTARQYIATLPDVVVSRYAAHSHDISWPVWVYGGVATLLLLRFAWQLGSVLWLTRHTDTTTVCGCRVHVMPRTGSAFSFFHYIFINPDTLQSQQQTQVMCHELTHARQWHSIDVLCAELMCALCWFNPVAWHMKNAIKLNLEYLADHRVMQAGANRKAYQYHLLSMSNHLHVATLTNNFNVLQLKKRIKMMNRKPTHKMATAKYALFVPLALLLFAVSSPDSAARIVSATATPTTTVAADSTYTLVEQMPSFNGGISALMDFLSKNLKYPADAKAQKKEGRVIVTFIVDEQGNIVEPRIMRPVFPSLDAEALRVVNAMPKWTPGRQKGKAVRVQYTLPLSFRIPPKTSTDKK